MHSCLNQAFQSAVEQGLIIRNPAKNATLTGTKEPQDEKNKFLSLTEFKNLLKYSQTTNHLSYLAIYLLIITGSRFKPIQKLKYDFISLNDVTIYLDDHKNKYSPRKVKVPRENIEYILNVIAHRKKNENGYDFLRVAI